MPRALSRRYCRDGSEYVWQIHIDPSGHESVGCTRCLVPLTTRELLETFVDRYGGKVLP